MGFRMQNAGIRGSGLGVRPTASPVGTCTQAVSPVNLGLGVEG